MPSRRAVLATTALGLASAAGCLQQGGDGGDDDDDSQVGDATRALPEPLGVEDPSVASVSDTDLAAIRESSGPLTEREDEIGRVVQRFEAAVDVISLADVDRVAGIGAMDVESGAQFLAAVVEGSYAVDDLTALIEADRPDLEARERGSYTWYDVEAAAEGTDYGGPGDDGTDGTESGTGQAVLALSERRVVFASVEAVDVDASELAGHVIDATSDDASPIDGLDDSLSATLEEVSEHPDVAAVAVEPGVIASETEVPEPLTGLDAVGTGTTQRSDGVSVEAILRFRSAGDADAGAIESHFQSAVGEDEDDPLVDAVEIEPADGPVVRASADLEGEAYETSEVASLLVLPLPAIASTFVLGFGSSSGSTGTGRSAPVPQVLWEFEQREDGRVEVTHAGGDPIQRPVEVRYRTGEDESERTEVWDPDDPIQAGDSFATGSAPATGTELRLVHQGEGTSVLIGQHTVT